MNVRSVAVLKLSRALFALAAVLACAIAQAAPGRDGAAIASAHPLATDAGYEILRAGGNAFDAAVAVGAALAVVEPYSSGLGGGGFWLLHRAADKHEVMVDARETAPAAATTAMFLGPDGKPMADATHNGGRAAAIPGVPAGLVHLAHNYGRLPLSRTLAPAIALARGGFAVDPRFAKLAAMRERFLRSGRGANIFLEGDKAPQAGYLLRQPDLAATLELLALQGRDGFYRGRIAEALVTGANATGGVWQLADLAEYKVIERVPVRFTYRGANITTAALPSGGGVTLAQSLNILERFSLGDARAPENAHLVIEALRRGFQDRALLLGDSDFVQVPLERLADKRYAAERAANIVAAQATPSNGLTIGATEKNESGNTTHYSVIDAAGNRVGATLSINFLFGSGVVPAGTGVLLNDEMDDFTIATDVANGYQLRRGSANRIEPRKRPLSSMTPTFVEDERGVLVLGAPGGSRIISQVLLGILDYMQPREVDLESLVRAPRYHHQFWPDRVEIEPSGFSAEWQAALAAKKHAIRIGARQWGNMQAVFRAKRDGAMQAASDPRGLDFGWY
jgi:gamma-glutamyltranspeptidase/glutathione hydrolase